MNCLARVTPNLLPGKFGMIDAFRLRVDDGVVEEPIKEERMANFGFFNKVAAKAREKKPRRALLQQPNLYLFDRCGVINQQQSGFLKQCYF
ncbi:MAG: hypothetical protein ACLQHK_03655 [Gallionellaceae bacterium]